MLLEIGIQEASSHPYEIPIFQDSEVLSTLQQAHEISERIGWIDDGILHDYIYPGNYKGVVIVTRISGTRNNFTISFGSDHDSNGFNESEVSDIVPVQFWYELDKLHTVEAMVSGNAVVSCAVQEVNGENRRNAIGYVTKYALAIYPFTEPYAYAFAPEIDTIVNAQRALHVLSMVLPERLVDK